jgi:hypothetical protein
MARAQMTGAEDAGRLNCLSHHIPCYDLSVYLKSE